MDQSRRNKNLSQRIRLPSIQDSRICESECFNSKGIISNMKRGDNQAMIFDLEPSNEIELQAMSELLHKSIGYIVFCSEDSTDLEDTVSLGTGVLISPDLILRRYINE